MKRRIYNNLADSVHYSRSKDVSPSVTTLPEIYIKKLNSFLESSLTEEDIIIGFSLNQISDNAVFYLDDYKNKKLFDTLKELFKRKKAFISIYNGYSTVSYAKNRILSSWKELCGDEENELQFVNSLIEVLARIDHKDKGFGNLVKEKAHQAVFGWRRLCKIENDFVYWGVDFKNCAQINDYVAEISNQSRQSQKFTFFTGLDNWDLFSRNNDETLKEIKIFAQRLYDLHSLKPYRKNSPFVKENDLTLDSVILYFINDEVLLRTIFDNTVDTTLKKRISNRVDDFLLAFRKAIENISSEKIEGTPNRSKYYRQAYYAVDNYFKDVMEYTYYEHNSRHNMPMSFFLQFIDFCYNYFNALQVFGAKEFEFEFYPYRTTMGTEILNDIGEPIRLNNIYRSNKIKYKVCFDGSKVRYYTTFANARKSAHELRTKGKTFLRILDMYDEVIEELS